MKKGFTLIELLVVISIIGVLTTIVIGSLNNARNKAGDIKRIAESQNLKTALEMYFLDNNTYPFVGNASYGFGAWTNNCQGDLVGNNRWNQLMAELSPYLSPISIDSSWPVCIYYMPFDFTVCDAQPYNNGYSILVGTNEQGYNLDLMNGSLNRFCLYSI